MRQQLEKHIGAAVLPTLFALKPAAFVCEQDTIFGIHGEFVNKIIMD